MASEESIGEHLKTSGQILLEMKPLCIALFVNVHTGPEGDSLHEYKWDAPRADGQYTDSIRSMRHSWSKKALLLWAVVSTPLEPW